MKKLVVFGIGKGASIVLNYFFPNDAYSIEAFCVDEGYGSTSEYEGVPVLTPQEVKAKFSVSDVKFFLPMGFNKMNDTRSDKFFEIRHQLEYFEYEMNGTLVLTFREFGCINR